MSIEMDKTNSIKDRIASLIKIHDSEIAQFTEKLARIPPIENCPKCGNSNQLDWDLSVKDLQVIYPCKPCDLGASEDKIVRRLQSGNVPNRLLRASIGSYEIYDPDQSKMIDQIQNWLSERTSKPLLYLGGTCGTGKGHIAAATVRRLMPKRAHWTSQAKLISGYHASKFSEKERFLKKFEKVPVLVIDELGGVTASKDTPELFFRILDERLDWKKPTIMVGNLSMQSVFEIIGGARMADRFAQSGVAIPFDWESYRRREAK